MSLSAPIAASAVMLVKNSERYLKEVLSALSDFAEVLLLDNGSTDNTQAIATQFANVSWHEHPFIGFGAMKNLAASYAQYDWIFSIDSDEIASPELISAIRQAVERNDPDAVYTLSRLNHYHGRLIKACGWYPDILPRLYHKAHTQFTPRQVHESLMIPENTHIIALKGYLKHYSFENASGLIQKMQQYSSLYAQEMQYRKSASPTKALLHGSFAFIKNYLLKNGWRYGADGFIISTANAQGAYYKYIKLYEHNQQVPTSLIITTYNRADALAAVLKSALAQSRLPNEILVADDGSRADTADTIAAIAAQSPIPIHHIWQEDDGFRLAQSRNRALAAATGDYIIIIDGDMVLEHHFIADHIRHAQLGRFIQGSRVLLGEQATSNQLNPSHQAPKLSPFNHDVHKRLSAIRLPLLSKLIARRGITTDKGIKGCNMGFFKADALAVNGFNNRFVGWGREDSEFVTRLYHNGIKRHNLKFSAIAYHLYHPEANRAALPENDALLQHTLQSQSTYCEDGVNRFLPKAENECQ